MATLIPVRGLDTTTASFRAALVRGALSRGLDPDHLATVISLESGFNPRAKNPHSGALGLIQWVSDRTFDATAARARMNVKRAQLPFLSAEQQLPLVFAWYDGVGKKPVRLVDHYLAVWGPAFIGKPDDFVAAREPALAYTQNAGFDRDGKGYFTIGDIARSITGVRSAALTKPRLPADPERVLRFAELMGAASVALFAYVLLPKIAPVRRALSLVG